MSELAITPQEMTYLVGLKEVELHLLRQRVAELTAALVQAKEAKDGRDDTIPQNLS